MSDEHKVRRCEVPGCGRGHSGHGLCRLHLNRLRRRGTLSLLNTEDRFWEKVDKTGDCWLWKASLFHTGYGHFHVKRRGVMAHRYSYEIAFGSIPEGYEVDHLCRVRACVNPHHLEAVPGHVNRARSTHPGVSAWTTDVCVNGHDLLDPTNVYRRPSRPTCRTCRACTRAAGARYKARKRAAPAEATP